MKRMMVLTIVAALLSLISQAQNINGTGGVFRPLKAEVFQSCKQVEKTAQILSAEISDRVHVMELYPDKKSLFMPFPSENHAPVAANWISNYHPERSPFALFYFVNGAYSFRCRDAKNQLFESAGPQRDPLRLKVVDGRASICHFFFTTGGVAHVFVLTDLMLRDIRGEELLAQVGTVLQAHFVFLYARNDPWFLGYSPDSLPYVFTDSFKRISEGEYRASQTLVCSTDQGCRVTPSFF